MWVTYRSFMNRSSTLIVEQLDRLSRLGISETGDLLMRILRDGLEIPGKIAQVPDRVKLVRDVFALASLGATS
jgi:hypothetical protein